MSWCCKTHQNWASFRVCFPPLRLAHLFGTMRYLALWQIVAEFTKISQGPSWPVVPTCGKPFNWLSPVFWCRILVALIKLIGWSLSSHQHSFGHVRRPCYGNGISCLWCLTLKPKTVGYMKFTDNLCAISICTDITCMTFQRGSRDQENKFSQTPSL